MNRIAKTQLNVFFLHPCLIQRAGGCPRDETPFPCETPSQPAQADRTQLWGPSSRPTVTSAPSGLSPPELSSALGRPTRARRHQVGANTFSLPGAPGADTSLPPSLLAGPFPGWETAATAAAAGSEALVDAVPWRVSPPSGGRPSSSRLWGAPLRACAVPRGGRGSDSCQRRRRWRRPSVFAEEKHETDPLAFPPPFPRPEPPLLARRELVPVEFPLRLAAVSSVLGPVEVTALEEEAAAAALASPPPVRCPRSRRGGAAATAAPPLPLPSGRAGSSCDALGLHLIAQRGPRPGIAQVPVLARFSEVTPITEFS
nr:uncharacterized protein LOC123855305 [Mirounga angustirostris]